MRRKARRAEGSYGQDIGWCVLMRYLTWTAFSFAAACALFVYVLPPAAAYALCAVCAAAAGVLLALRRRRLRCAVVALLGLAAGFAWCMVFRLAFYQPVLDAAAEVEVLDGTVCDMPEQLKYGSSVIIRTKLAGHTVKIRLYVRGDVANLRPGDRITAPALLTAVTGSTGLDSLYYNASGIWLTAELTGSFELTRPERVLLRDRPALVRLMVREKIGAVFDADVAPFMTALLTGGRSQLTAEQVSDLQTAGVYHVVSVSGMHVSILLGFLLAGLSGRRRIAAFVGIPAAAAFIAFIGGTPGVMRAGITYMFSLAAPLVCREADPPTSLGTALLVMLVVNPFAIANTGLQLSFAATAGILLFCTRLQAVVTKADWFCRLRGACRYLAAAVRFLTGILATTLSALVFTVPLMAYWFGTVSLVAPLANLLVLPAVSGCFVLGLIAAALALLFPAAAAPFAFAAKWLARYILGAAHLAAQAPYAQLSTASPFVTAWLLFAYVVIALLCAFRPLRARPVLPACALVLTLAASLLLAAFSARFGGGSVTALDVGQGACTLLQFGSFTAVVDCGGDGSPGDLCAQALLDAGDAAIEALILTHFDEDHIGGVETLLRRVSVGAVYLPLPAEDDTAEQAVANAAAAAGVPVYVVMSDTVLSFSAGTITIFAPIGADSDNNSGLSALATSGEFDVLITGDMDAATENHLLAQKTIPDLEVLVAGHHGARTSTGARLLADTSPEVVLISVGENRYGHPAEETLARIEETGAAVFRTDECGSITIRR